MASHPAPTYRAQQAAATRTRIVQTARAEFYRHGYGATTIAGIAEAAGVAVPTVYKLFRSKPRLLAAVVDSWWAQWNPKPLRGNESARDAIAWWCAVVRRQWETGLDIATIFAGAITSNPDAREELQTRLGRRETVIRSIAKQLRPKLRRGVTPETAAALLAALTVPEVYRELVRDRGWSADDYERWLNETLNAQLLK
jgi:AcrR family transcriptional regulator